MHVAALWIYPVKSAQGVSLDEVEVDDFGLALDRRWMFVDAEGGFLSQRSEAALARVRVAPTREGWQLDAPGVPPLLLPRLLTADNAVAREVTIWSDRCLALENPELTAAWATAALGRPASLVMMPSTSHRGVPTAFGRPGERMAFTDDNPLLLTSEQSLADVNSRLREPVPMNRFRPNIVVAGAPAWSEDAWSTVTIGQLVFRPTNRCGRCLVTTTDQSTGVRSAEPLRSMAQHRLIEGKVRFGRNLVQLGPGMLRCGDEVQAA